MSNASTKNQHLSIDLLTRGLDDEVSTAERFEVEGHLAVCEFCRNESAALHQVSMDIEFLVEKSAADLLSSAQVASRRLQLQTALEASVHASVAHPAPNAGLVMRRFGWGMAIAASLAFGILLAPRANIMNQAQPSGMSPLAQSRSVSPVPSSIEVDGESFAPLPYSNPDLPVSEEHIVQMQVPVSSLSDLGIMLEPVVSRGDRSEDATVLADVLLGSDGQPRGVHVLGAEQQF